MPKLHVTYQRLRQLLEYNEETGIFIWKLYRGRLARVGDVAGCLNEKGYIAIHIAGKTYKAHRLAWLYVHGNNPDDQIDHMNGIRNDNRIINLRQATNALNGRNRKPNSNKASGLPKGVVRRKTRDIRPFEVYIRLNYKRIYLGSFDTPEEASLAYQEASQRYHGIYGRT